jgi:hypothetical protein
MPRKRFETLLHSDPDTLTPWEQLHLVSVMVRAMG